MDSKIEQPKTEAEIIFKKKRGKNKIKAVLTAETIQAPSIKDIIEVRFTF